MSQLLPKFAEYSLPPGDRAQVLGDLEERGFRLRDILSVLSGAWKSHLRREWLGPIPNLRGANEAALRRRIEQLSPRHELGWLLASCALSVALLRLFRVD